MNNIFKSKFFIKFFCIPSLVWFFSSILAMIPNKTDTEVLMWSDVIITDVLFIILWFLISLGITYVYNKKNAIVNKTIVIDKNVEKRNAKRIVFPLQMCIITFIIGSFFTYISKSIPIKMKMIVLILSYTPFILFLIVTLLYYKFKNRKKLLSILKTFSMMLTCLLLFYYFTTLLLIGLEMMDNPITDIRYYKRYVKETTLTKVFPKEISNDAENIEFYYAPGILQGGTNYSLYYIDKNMTHDKFDNQYNEQSIWIGRKDEYTDREGLLSSAFSHTPAKYTNEDDYIIYLIKGKCDNSGYCNHGEFSFAAYNDKTKEVIYRAESW